MRSYVALTNRIGLSYSNYDAICSVLATQYTSELVSWHSDNILVRRTWPLVHCLC